jgi:hypothetical protein
LLYDHDHGNHRLAHRVSWELHHGEIPDGMQVCHKCDTPSCVNPDHLFLGTPQENHADMRRKGRSVPPRGERNGHAILTEAQVRAIRQDPRTARRIAPEYGVKEWTIHGVKSRRTWAHIN